MAENYQCFGSSHISWNIGLSTDFLPSRCYTTRFVISLFPGTMYRWRTPSFPVYTSLQGLLFPCFLEQCIVEELPPSLFILHYKVCYFPVSWNNVSLKNSVLPCLYYTTRFVISLFPGTMYRWRTPSFPVYTTLQGLLFPCFLEQCIVEELRPSLFILHYKVCYFPVSWNNVSLKNSLLPCLYFTTRFVISLFPGTMYRWRTPSFPVYTTLQGLLFLDFLEHWIICIKMEKVTIIYVEKKCLLHLRIVGYSESV